MAEISRKECIKIINTIWLACGSKGMCINTTTEEMRMCCKKAISDMEKVEKIEQMIDECRAWTDDMAECLIEIEQIVKGE